MQNATSYQRCVFVDFGFETIEGERKAEAVALLAKHPDADKLLNCLDRLLLAASARVADKAHITHPGEDRRRREDLS